MHQVVLELRLNNKEISIQVFRENNSWRQSKRCKYFRLHILYVTGGGGSFEATGEILLRFAAPDNWMARSDYVEKVNNIGNQNTANQHARNKFIETNSVFEESGYTAIITNHTTGQVEEYHVTSTVASVLGRDFTGSGDSSTIPRFESPLTFDDGHATIFCVDLIQ